MGELLGARQRRSAGRLRRGDDVLAARGRHSRRARDRHVRAALHGAGERQGLQRGRSERVQRELRAAGLLHPLDRRVRHEDGRPGVVVPRRGRCALAAGVRLAAGDGDLVRGGVQQPRARRRCVGSRRFRSERLPDRKREGQAHRRRCRREERRLRPARREDGRLCLEHAGRPGRRPGRLRVGHGLRRQPDLRLDHEPSPHPVQADRERDAHEHDRHRRLVGCARSRDREDPLADG